MGIFLAGSLQRNPVSVVGGIPAEGRAAGVVMLRPREHNPFANLRVRAQCRRAGDEASARSRRSATAVTNHPVRVLLSSASRMSTAKGKRFEAEFFEDIKKDISRFALPPDRCKVFLNKAYPSLNTPIAGS